MPLWITGEILFYTGTVLISFAAIGAVISAIILHISKNRLNKQLDAEFGSRH